MELKAIMKMIITEMKIWKMELNWKGKCLNL